MTEELARLHGLVGALSRRERALLVWQVLLRGGVLAALGLVGAAVAAWREVPHAQAITWLVLGLGAGGWFGLGAPWVARWRRSADPVRQARRVEALDPALRGRLLTAIGRPQGAIGQESPAVLALVARRALAITDRIPPEQVHPNAPVRRWAVGVLVAWSVALVGLAVVPGGGIGVWHWWFGGAEAVAAGVDLTAMDVAASARVGDLTLRYVYPSYTGLEPLEVVNSTGEAHGPPGTRVEVIARSAEQVDAASLVAYDAPALDAKVTDGRTIAASFSIGAETGTYQLHTTVDGELRVSKAFAIVPEPDLPPEVTIDASGDVIEVPLDGVMPVRWQASDDYGITRVALLVDGKQVGADLRRPRERLALVDDEVRRRPMDLGMEAGGTYEVVIAAWDNDTVAGAKQGNSPPLRVRVIGEDGVARLSDEQRLELLDLLVDVLGDHLEETWPPGRLSGDYARWGEVVNRRYEPLATFMERYHGAGSRSPEWPPVLTALDDGRTLVRYSQVSFVPRSADPANGSSVEAVSLFRQSARDSVEAAVLHVDALIRNKLLKDFAEQAVALSDEADELQAQVEDPSADPRDLSMPAELLDEFVQRVAAMAESLDEGGLKDFVATRSAEARSQMKSARESLAAGKLEDVGELMERVASTLHDMSRGITEELDKRKDRAKQGDRDAEDLSDTLRALAEAQESLAGRAQEIQEAGGEPYRKAIADLWARIEAKAGDIRSGLDRFGDAMNAAASPDDRSDVEFNVWTLFDGVHEQASGLVDAAVARDLTGLRMGVLELNADWGRYRARHDNYVRVGVTIRGPGAAEGAVIQRDIDALLDLIEQLRRRDEAGDPGLREEIRSLESEQRQLQADLEDAQRDAKRVIQMLPVTPRELEPALAAGKERMEQAGDELRRGDGVQAQGSQLAASGHVREALRALEQAQQSAAQQQQEMSEGGGQGGDGEPQPSGGKDQQGEQPDDRFELPEPEDFRTPEAYRQALLRGMEGEVPEEYRALKRRYYEELVHQ